MILNNYRKLLGKIFSTTSSSIINDDLVNTTNNENYIGCTFNSYVATCYSCNHYKESSNDNDITIAGSNNSNFGLFLIVGTGSTEPTIDDYKLENFLELTPISAAISYYKNKTIMAVSRTFQNMCDENVTISEIGLCTCIQTNGSYNNHYLLVREVLDTPVTIEPGKMHTFTIAIQ